MQTLFRCLIVSAAVILVSGRVSFAAGQDPPAPDLKLSMADGRVTLVAREVPLRQILAEWARVGNTRIVNAEKLAGPPLTLELVDCPEGKALDLLLRQAAGYMAAPRPADQPGVSVYDRIMILPTSRPPAVNATAAPPPFNRNLMPQPMPVPVDDDNAEPGDQGLVPPPGMPAGMPPGMVPQGVPLPGPQPLPGAVPQGTQQQPVLTAPRPGQLPQPQPQPQGINPYAPPGARPQVPPPGRPGGGPSDK